MRRRKGQKGGEKEESGKRQTYENGKRKKINDKLQGMKSNGRKKMEKKNININRGKIV